MDIINYGVNDGHTIRGFGSGAVGIINESQHTRIVGAEIRKLIKERGHNAINCTIDYANSSSESLALIIRQANRADLDWFISIHFNAGGGLGVEVYTYAGRQYQDALDVCKNISALGFKNRGVKDGKGLYVIRKTKAKSMLIEVCFVDTNDANHYLKTGYRAIAKAIVDGILGTVKATPVVTPKPVIKAPAPLNAQLYRVRQSWGDATSQINAFADIQNAKDCVNAHKGYIAFNSKGVQVYPTIIPPVVINKDIWKTVTASVLNIRSSRSITNNIVGQLKKGTKVKVDRDFSNGWTSIYFGNHGGFVSTQYLK
jgi:uncharacterized protein YgiM (DUF1202 family)